MNEVIALEGNGARPSHLVPGYSDDGVMYTINTAEKHKVCYSVENHPNDSRVKMDNADTVQTLSSRMGTGGGNVPLVLDGLKKKYVLRRLTPLECARLQGFPDWWTDDADGGDSNKYKMWGNGIGLPNAYSIMKKLAKALKEEKGEQEDG